VECVALLVGGAAATCHWGRPGRAARERGVRPARRHTPWNLPSPPRSSITPPTCHRDLPSENTVVRDRDLRRRPGPGSPTPPFGTIVRPTNRSPVAASRSISLPPSKNATAASPPPCGTLDSLLALSDDLVKVCPPCPPPISSPSRSLLPPSIGLGFNLM
jgi:hypothetical protein